MSGNDRRFQNGDYRGGNNYQPYGGHRGRGQYGEMKRSSSSQGGYSDRHHGDSYYERDRSSYRGSQHGANYDENESGYRSGSQSQGSSGGYYGASAGSQQSTNEYTGMSTHQTYQQGSTSGGSYSGSHQRDSDNWRRQYPHEDSSTYRQRSSDHYESRDYTRSSSRPPHHRRERQFDSGYSERRQDYHTPRSSSSLSSRDEYMPRDHPWDQPRDQDRYDGGGYTQQGSPHSAFSRRDQSPRDHLRDSGTGPHLSQSMETRASGSIPPDLFQSGGSSSGFPILPPPPTAASSEEMDSYNQLRASEPTYHHQYQSQSQSQSQSQYHHYSQQSAYASDAHSATSVRSSGGIPSYHKSPSMPSSYGTGRGSYDYHQTPGGSGFAPPLVSTSTSSSKLPPPSPHTLSLSSSSSVPTLRESVGLNESYYGNMISHFKSLLGDLSYLDAAEQESFRQSIESCLLALQSLPALETEVEKTKQSATANMTAIESAERAKREANLKYYFTDFNVRVEEGDLAQWGRVISAIEMPNGEWPPANWTLPPFQPLDGHPTVEDMLTEPVSPSPSMDLSFHM